MRMPAQHGETRSGSRNPPPSSTEQSTTSNKPWEAPPPPAVSPHPSPCSPPSQATPANKRWTDCLAECCGRRSSNARPAKPSATTFLPSLRRHDRSTSRTRQAVTRRSSPFATPVAPSGKGERIVTQYKSEVRDQMRVDWDVPISMDDGVVLRADVFRPIPDGDYPVIMTHGPYAKGLAFQDGYPGMWKILATKYPEVMVGSST